MSKVDPGTLKEEEDTDVETANGNPPRWIKWGSQHRWVARQLLQSKPAHFTGAGQKESKVQDQETLGN